MDTLEKLTHVEDTIERTRAASKAVTAARIGASAHGRAWSTLNEASKLMDVAESQLRHQRRELEDQLEREIPR